jgi:excisionase family DNA binding protein
LSNSYYTVDSAAEKLDVHPRTVLRFINQGKLKAVKVGRQWRIKNIDLRAFIGEPVEERKSSASAVIDIPVSDRNEADRYQTLVMASLNSRNGNVNGIDRRVDCIYNREEQTVRFVLWGGISFVKDFFTLLDNYS